MWFKCKLKPPNKKFKKAKSNKGRKSKVNKNQNATVVNRENHTEDGEISSEDDDRRIEFNRKRKSDMEMGGVGYSNKSFCDSRAETESYREEEGDQLVGWLSSKKGKSRKTKMRRRLSLQDSLNI